MSYNPIHTFLTRILLLDEFEELQHNEIVGEEREGDTTTTNTTANLPLYARTDLHIDIPENNDLVTLSEQGMDRYMNLLHLIESASYQHSQQDSIELYLQHLTTQPPEREVTVPEYSDEELETIYKYIRENDCSICYEPFTLDQMEEKSIYKTTCNHIFHLKCCQIWFRTHPKCPLCRTPLPL